MPNPPEVRMPVLVARYVKGRRATAQPVSFGVPEGVAVWRVSWNRVRLMRSGRIAGIETTRWMSFVAGRWVTTEDTKRAAVEAAVDHQTQALSK